MISICELLVARRICKKIVLSRLPVGHTHEDIDAIFALIWKNLMNESALTPEQYKALVLESIGGKETLHDVFDLFVIPNYTKFLQPAADKKLGRYSKLDWTQLQIIFDSTDVCDEYPCGVKITYRAYSSNTVTAFRKTKRPDGTNVVDKLIEKDPLLSYEKNPEDTTGIPHGKDPNIGDNDNAIEIEVEEDMDIGFVPVQLHVKTYPLRDEPAVHNLAYVPEGKIQPDAFVENSREILDKVVEHIDEKYRHVLPTIVEEWKIFAAKAPATNDAEEYCATHPMYIPFGEQLFPKCYGNFTPAEINPIGVVSSRGGTLVQDYNNARNSATSSSLFPSIQAVTQPCVQWSNNGGPAINIPPVRYIQRSTDATLSSLSSRNLASHAERCMGESGWEYTDSGEMDFNDAASSHSSEAEMPTDAMGWTSVHHRRSAVPRYGIASNFIGKSFRRVLTPKALRERGITSCSDPFRESRVVDVVLKRSDE